MTTRRATTRLGWAALALTFVAAAVAGAGGAATLASFSNATQNPGNSFQSATLDPPSGLSVTETCSGGGIEFRGAASNGTDGSPLVISKPAGVVEGDVMLAAVVSRFSSDNPSAPSGWTVLRNDINSLRQKIWYKVAGASEPSSYSFGGTGRSAGGIVAYGGVDPSNPIDVHNAQAGSGSTVTAPSITTTAANARLVGMFAILDDSTMTVPATMTQRFNRGSLGSGNSSGRPRVAAADQLHTGPGATGTRSATSTASASNIGALIALRPIPTVWDASLSWTATPTTWASGYKLQRWVGAAQQNEQTVTPRTQTTAGDGPLVADTAYTFKLTAFYGTWRSTEVTADLTTGATCGEAVGGGGDTGGDAITFVKTVGTVSCGGTSSTITVPAGGVAAGNTLIVRFSQRGSVPGVVSASDSRGNAYTEDADIRNTSASQARVVLLSAHVQTALASGDTITVTHPDSDAEGVAVAEFSGIASTNRVDVTGTNTGFSTAPSASLTTTNANDLLYGAVSNRSNLTYTEDAGWTTLEHQELGCASAATYHGAYRVVSATGTYTYAPTMSGSEIWAEAVVAYKAAGGGGTATYRQTVMDDSPVAYWRLGDTATATVLSDDFETFSGWSNIGAGTFTQSSEQARGGTKSGKKDTNNDAAGGGSKSLGTTLGDDWTFETWVYRPSSYTGGGQDRIGVESSGGNGYSFSIDHSTNAIVIDRRDAGSPTTLASAALDPPENAWVRAVLSRSGSSLTFTLYNAAGNQLGTVSASDATHSSYERVAVRGGYQFYLDDLKVTRGTSTAADEQGTHDATYAGGVSLGGSGALAGDTDTSVSLDGNDDHVIHNPFNGMPATAISVEFWMKSSDTSKAGTPISYAASSTANNEFLILDYRNLAIHVHGASVSTGVSANDGAWHHIVVTWRTSDWQAKLYKDGVQAWSGTLNAGGQIQNGGSWVLGQEQDSLGGGFDPAQAFLGNMDEVAIYNTVLSATRVQAHYDAGT